MSVRTKFGFVSAFNAIFRVAFISCSFCHISCVFAKYRAKRYGAGLAYFRIKKLRFLKFPFFFIEFQWVSKSLLRKREKLKSHFFQRRKKWTKKATTIKFSIKLLLVALPRDFNILPSVDGEISSVNWRRTVGWIESCVLGSCCEPEAICKCCN